LGLPILQGPAPQRQCTAAKREAQEELFIFTMQNLSVNDLHKREEISGMKLSLHEKKIYYVYDGSDHTHKRLGTDRQCEPGAKISKAHDLLPLT